MKDTAVSTVTSVEMLLTKVRNDYREWGTNTFPWFRGEPLISTTPLLPALFREPGRHDENRLLQRFRMRALSLGIGAIPPRDYTDQWLFLARHVGLPTRLLDWTEGLLTALLFAVYDSRGEPRTAGEGATVWMLDPVELNRQSTPGQPSRDNEFPLTWINEPTAPPSREDVLSWLAALVGDKPPDPNKYPDKTTYFTAIRNSIPSNIGAMNIRRAWGAPDGTDLPVAVYPAHIHPRITAQKGCFTIHGKREQSLSELVPARILRQYRIAPESLEAIRSDLRLTGVTYSAMFPDLDGLAADLRSWF